MSLHVICSDKRNVTLLTGFTVLRSQGTVNQDLMAAHVLTVYKVQTSIPQICRIFTNKHNNRNQLFSRCDRTRAYTLQYCIQPIFLKTSVVNNHPKTIEKILTQYCKILPCGGCFTYNKFDDAVIRHACNRNVK